MPALKLSWWILDLSICGFPTPGANGAVGCAMAQHDADVVGRVRVRWKWATSGCAMDLIPWRIPGYKMAIKFLEHGKWWENDGKTTIQHEILGYPMVPSCQTNQYSMRSCKLERSAEACAADIILLWWSRHCTWSSQLSHRQQPTAVPAYLLSLSGINLAVHWFTRAFIPSGCQKQDLFTSICSHKS